MEKEKFNNFQYWDGRYSSGGNSGAGSYNDEGLMKAKVINEWIVKHKLNNIQEVGCGDGANMLLYNIPNIYCGYDISPTAVRLCEEKIKGLSNKQKYIFTFDKDLINYTADVCLLLDVFYHIVDDEDFEELCYLLFERSNFKYIIAYTTDTNSTKVLIDGQYVEQAPHLSQRSFTDTYKKYPKYELLEELTEYTTPNQNTFVFPNNKKMFLLRNKL
jgi:hypothetical protein